MAINFQQFPLLVIISIKKWILSLCLHPFDVVVKTADRTAQTSGNLSLALALDAQQFDDFILLVG